MPRYADNKDVDHFADDLIMPGEIFPAHWRAVALLQGNISPEAEDFSIGANEQVNQGTQQVFTVCSLCGKVLKNLKKGRWVETVDGVVQPNHGTWNPATAKGFVVLWPVGGKCLKKIHPNVMLKETDTI